MFNFASGGGMKRSRLDYGEIVRFDFARFGWDPDKAAENLRKHGADFEDARFIFDRDVLAIAEIEGGEERWLAVGVIDGQEYAIAFAEYDESCRVISFRRASRKERLAYHLAYARGTG
jgi:uncharacterized protein